MDKKFDVNISAMIENDLKIVENIISMNRVLREYFSPIPSNSYHVTIFGIKNTCNRLFLDDSGKNDLLYRYSHICEKKGWEKNLLNVKKVALKGSKIVIHVSNTCEIDNLAATCNWTSSPMDRDYTCQSGKGQYYVVIASLQKQVSLKDTETVQKEIEMIDMVMKGMTISILDPKIYIFSSLVEFNTWKGI